MKKLSYLGVALAGVASGATLNATQTPALMGFCFQPTAPTVFISRPSLPYCASTRSCSDWQVQSYEDEVERYYRRLRDYAQQVDRYYEDAGTYIRCMSRLD